MTLIAGTLQAFFTDRLSSQRHASPRTIAAYRDTLRLLLVFVHQRNGKPPSRLDWGDLDVTTIQSNTVSTTVQVGLPPGVWPSARALLPLGVGATFRPPAVGVGPSRSTASLRI